jgi:hypothetical protein
MKNYQEINSALERGWGNDPIFSTCTHLIKQLHKEKPEKLRMLTFRNLVDIIQKKSIDEELIKALIVLESLEVKVLEKHYLFIDDNDEEFEYAAEDLSKAEKDGGLAHPITGQLLIDYKKFIFPYFSLNQELLD